MEISQAMDRTFKIVKKFSDLNCRIVDQSGRLHVLHVNRLKRAYNTEVWKPKFERSTKKRWQKESRTPAKQNEEDIKFNPFPLAMTDGSLCTPEREPPPPENPEIIQSEVDTPCSELKDASYHPSETPKSRREFQSTRTETPITRSRELLREQFYVHSMSGEARTAKKFSTTNRTSKTG